MNEREARTVLGIGDDASLDDAKRAHRNLVKVLHPDLAGSSPEAIDRATEATARVNQAWAVIQDLNTRGLLGTFTDTDSSDNWNVQGATFQFRPRPPHSGECLLCGSYPATEVSFRSAQTFLIWAQTRGVNGPLCRSCGLGLFRDSQSDNLTRGWWGIGMVFMLAYLISNLASRYQVMRLGVPAYRDVTVMTPTDMPLPPGRPVGRRLGVIAATLVVIVAGSLVVVSAANTNSRPTAATPTPSPTAPVDLGDRSDGMASANTYTQYRDGLIDRLNADTSLSLLRRACLTTAVRNLSSVDLGLLQIEDPATGQTWEQLWLTCDGAFVGDCYKPVGDQYQGTACNDPAATLRVSDIVPVRGFCPPGTVILTSPDPTEQLCMRSI